METLKNLTLIQWIGIAVGLNSLLMGATPQLTILFGEHAVPYIVALATLGNGALGVFVTVIGGLGSQVRNVLAMPGVEKIAVNGQANSTLAAIAVDPTQNKIAPTTAAMDTVTATAAKAAVIMAIMVLAALAFPHPASAQIKVRAPQVTGDFIGDAKANLGITRPVDPAATAAPSGTKLGDSGCKATGDPIGDLHCVIKAGGAKLVLHLKQSYALASAPGSNGGLTDNTSAMCTKALVPIVDLVVNGPKSGTIAAGDPMALTSDEQAAAANTSEPDGPIVIIEKIRILRLAIQSPALNDACGALVQDEVKNAQSLVGKVTSLITGAGILAPLGL